MIYTDDPQDLKAKLADAVAGTFSLCLHEQEYRIATHAIVEFLTALNLTSEELFEVTRRAYGMDAQTDDCIDQLIEAFAD